MHQPMLPASRRAFTLVELLIAIGIVAVLSTVAVVSINPSQLLSQGRDSNRISDMSSLGIAIADYQSSVRGSMGSSSTIYISVPDPSATSTAGDQCQGLGLATSSVFTYHCAASTTYRNIDGTGWVPLNFKSISPASPIATLPVDPINTTSSSFYYEYLTDGTGWKIIALPESAKYSTASNINSFVQSSNAALAGGFPTNWIPVPGNSTFGTPNFWVMQYEAKCEQTSNNAPMQTVGAAYDVYRGYNNAATGYACTGGSYHIASDPNGFPIVGISHTTAAAYCAAAGAHLWTNDEYMTIATNAANLGSNWSGGSVGSGTMPYGNSNSVNLQYDGTTQYGTGYSDFAHLRILNLSNGDVIWDFAGNIWEHVQRSQNNSGDNTNSIAMPSCSAYPPDCEYGSSPGGHGNNYITSYNDSSFSAATVAPPNNSWNTYQGVGDLNIGSAPGTVFLRGGGDDNGPEDGAFELYLGWNTASTNGLTGFRCAL
jgi:prepilin-type N-terminal cleavage/methylation domain-containing protein